MTAVESRWWWGNALCVYSFLAAIGFAIFNIIVGGASITAGLMVVFWFLSLIAGYLSIVPFYIDVRTIRASDVDYSPRAWLYVLGYIFMSPILASGVYLWNRRKNVPSEPEGQAA